MRAKKADCKLPTPPVREKWADTFRLMTDRDKRTPRQIAQVIRYATQDEFWAPNVRSASKLREKFDALDLAMQRGKGASGGGHGAASPPPPPQKSVERQRKLEAYLERMHKEAGEKPAQIPDLDAYIAAKKGAAIDDSGNATRDKGKHDNGQPGATQAPGTGTEGN